MFHRNNSDSTAKRIRRIKAAGSLMSQFPLIFFMLDNENWANVMCVFFNFSITIDIQYYFIVVWYLYSLQSNPNDKASTHRTPYIFIIILLTILSMMYFIYLWLFCSYQLVLFNPFTIFTQPSTFLPSSQSHLVNLVFYFALLTFHHKCVAAKGGMRV